MEKIIFKNYISDGPGYAGDIHITIHNNVLTQYMEKDRIVRIELLNTLPDITEIKDMARDDAERVFSRLDEGTQEYIEDPKFVDLSRVVMLKFEDGNNGFMAVFGEPCFMTLVSGDLALDINEGIVNTRLVDFITNTQE